MLTACVSIQQRQAWLVEKDEEYWEHLHSLLYEAAKFAKNLCNLIQPKQNF